MLAARLLSTSIFGLLHYLWRPEILPIGGEMRLCHAKRQHANDNTPIRWFQNFFFLILFFFAFEESQNCKWCSRNSFRILGQWRPRSLDSVEEVSFFLKRIHGTLNIEIPFSAFLILPGICKSIEDCLKFLRLFHKALSLLLARGKSRIASQPRSASDIFDLSLIHHCFKTLLLHTRSLLARDVFHLQHPNGIKRESSSPTGQVPWLHCIREFFHHQCGSCETVFGSSMRTRWPCNLCRETFCKATISWRTSSSSEAGNVHQLHQPVHCNISWIHLRPCHQGNLWRPVSSGDSCYYC